MRFKSYLEYAESNTDEMPLYLFDKHFAMKAPYLTKDYEVPEYFRDDMFAVLGEDGRPDYRWGSGGGECGWGVWRGRVEERG